MHPNPFGSSIRHPYTTVINCNKIWYSHNGELSLFSYELFYTMELCLETILKPCMLLPEHMILYGIFCVYTIFEIEDLKGEEQIVHSHHVLIHLYNYLKI